MRYENSLIITDEVMGYMIRPVEIEDPRIGSMSREQAVAFLKKMGNDPWKISPLTIKEFNVRLDGHNVVHAE